MIKGFGRGRGTKTRGKSIAAQRCKLVKNERYFLCNVKKSKLKTCVEYQNK